MKGGLIIVICFLSGVFVGQAHIIESTMGNEILGYALYALLLLAGMCMGFDTRNFLIVREFGFKILLLPVVIVAGTVLASALAWIALSFFGHNISLRDSIGVGAGLGYYSLSSVIITRLGNAELGSVALLANISRELFTLLFAPLMVRIAGGLAPVAAGGAPTMDTCMPVIAKYAGERHAIIGIFSGMILTMLVPVLVTAIFTYF